MKFTVNIGASTNLDRLDGSRSAVTERSQQHIARWTVSACFWQDFAKPEGSRGAKTCTVPGLQINIRYIRYNGLKVWHTANTAHIRVIYLRDPLFSDIILSVKAAMATESSAPVAALDTQVLAAAAADTDICELRQAPDSSGQVGQVLGVFSSCTYLHHPHFHSRGRLVLAQQTWFRAIALDLSRPSSCGLCQFPQLISSRWGSA